MQLGFRDGELRETAMQTDHKLREDQDRRLVQSLPSRGMDVNLRVEVFLIM